jgi:hypothetical protein
VFTQLYGIWYPCNLYEVVLVTGSYCDEARREIHLQTPGAEPGATVNAQLSELVGGAPGTGVDGQFHVLRLGVDAITGRFVFASDGWSLDLSLDIAPATGASCTL